MFVVSTVSTAQGCSKLIAHFCLCAKEKIYWHGLNLCCDDWSLRHGDKVRTGGWVTLFLLVIYSSCEELLCLIAWKGFCPPRFLSFLCLHFHLGVGRLCKQLFRWWRAGSMFTRGRINTVNNPEACCDRVACAGNNLLGSDWNKLFCQTRM